MMRPANLRDHRDLAHLGWLHYSGLRTVLGKTAVGPRLVVVVEVSSQDLPEVVLVEDHDVVGALAAEGADHFLDERILTKRSR